MTNKNGTEPKDTRVYPKGSGEPTTSKERPNTEDTRVFPKRDDDSAKTSNATRLKSQRIAAIALGIVSIALIAFSAFSLAQGGNLGGLLQTTAMDQGTTQVTNPSSSDAQETAKNTDEVNDADAKEDAAENSDADSATADQSAKSDASSKGGSSNTSNSATGSTGTSSSDNSASNSSSSQQQGGTTANGNAAGGNSSAQKPATVTVSITVDASAAGGGTLASTTLTFNEGATAYDALCGCGVSVNARNSQFGVYVAGIGGYAEKEHGDMSGWTYYVNGVYANRSCAAWTLKDGDSISWVYVTG